MKKTQQVGLIVFVITLFLTLAGVVLNKPTLYTYCGLISAIALAYGIPVIETLKGYQYTLWIIAAVVAGMLFPQAFGTVGGINLRDKTLILVIIQLVMLGMGTHMSLHDFKSLATTGKGVLVALFCQFTIMPLMGFLLTRVFDFEPEIAAGIILIGSCSSGMASNVMVYLAKANLVLSVIVTAMATLLSPFLTPFLMKTLAGTLIHINFMDMMIEIVKIVLVPIGAALFHDFLKKATSNQYKKSLFAVIGCAIWIVLVVVFVDQISSLEAKQSFILSGFIAGAAVAGFVYNLLYKNFPVINKIMPYISMFGIIYFTTVTTAAGRDNLLKIGYLLFMASVIHNAAGYFLGYWFSRMFGMDKNSSRSIAFEVGLQNGGMASGLAGSMGKLGTVGLAAAVFSPWMNISGSILANYWKKHQVAEDGVK
jgi:bile acid:Na+ symporter, BASS family